VACRKGRFREAIDLCLLILATVLVAAIVIILSVPEIGIPVIQWTAAWIHPLPSVSTLNSTES
jgi:hypothetical protein